MADASAEVALQRGLGIAAEDRARLPHARPGAARASTGPRHRCRGSSSRRRTCRRQPPGLQRGLGIAAEDRKRAFVAVGSLGVASTGPRHRCRGSAPSATAWHAVREASTGPRHRCRGSVRPGWGALLCISFFNGASASLPRIVPDAGCHRHELLLFNGASASLPRIGLVRRRPRRALIASTGPRHRCRGSAVTYCFTGVGASASTGPRHRCRGSEPRVPHHVGGDDVLQRGLGIAAEDRCGTPSALPPRAGLQRGLGIAAEDRPSEPPWEAQPTAASTGPRHRCRGSRPQGAHAHGIHEASTGPRHRCRGSPTRSRAARSRRSGFNGASASLPRIAAASEAALGSVTVASTGPRHRCRGSSPICPSTTSTTRWLQRGLGIAAEDRRGTVKTIATTSE